MSRPVHPVSQKFHDFGVGQTKDMVADKVFGY
jgi:hypothetical protein